jgi:hypothetical protein
LKSLDTYRMSQNYRSPSLGLSRGHRVDQVKMLKKKLLPL